MAFIDICCCDLTFEIFEGTGEHEMNVRLERDCVYNMLDQQQRLEMAEGPPPTGASEKFRIL